MLNSFINLDDDEPGVNPRSDAFVPTELTAPTDSFDRPESILQSELQVIA